MSTWLPILPINEDMMNELVPAKRVADWRRLKALVLDSVSSPITRRVYNLGLDEFFEWFGREPRSGFNKATVSTWRVALATPMPLSTAVEAGNFGVGAIWRDMSFLAALITSNPFASSRLVSSPSS